MLASHLILYFFLRMIVKNKLNTRLSCVFLSCCAALSFSSAANAAGFQLTEQSVAGMGRSHAGAGIVGDDLSAVHYNAAGMTLLPGLQMQVAGTYVALDIDYKGLDGSTENGRDKPTAVPATFITYQINDSLWAGLGITSPYGMKIRYGNDWSARERGISGSIITVDINPNIAWKANEMFSFGFGVSALYTHSKLKNGLPGSLSVGGMTVPLGGEFEYKGSDWMFTYNLGMMFSPTEDLRFGLSYRSAAHVTARGDYTIRGNGLANGTGSGKGKLETPETVYITGTWKPVQSLRLSALARWANWKNFETMDFTMDDPDNLSFTPIGQIAAGSNPVAGAAIMGRLSNMPLENNWKSVWLFSLGADYDINEQWTIRGGIAYETNPIKHQELRTALIPDTSRLWLTCGFSWKPTANWQIDAAYGHIRGIGDRDLYNHSGQKIGKFEKMNAWMAGASVTYRF